MPMPIFFNQLLISMNLHQYPKNQVFSSVCSRDIVNLKILLLAPCQNLEEVNDTIQRKCQERRNNGWTEGQTDRP